MSFLATRSTFVRLLLFVALIGLGYAQDTPSPSARGNSISAPCGDDEFECRNGECLPNALLCDGRADCSDQSDETEFECSKPELSCPDYTFRCKYGACIDQELVCNGRIECVADGSDEDTSGVCYSESSPGTTQPPVTSFATDNPQRVPGSECRLPPRPTNGRFQLRQISDDNDIKYIDPPSPVLAIDSQLVYTCYPGYKIRGNAVVSCLPSGKWTRKPVCIEIRCRPLGSVSTMGNCMNASGRKKPCNAEDPVRPGTMAELSCRPGYRDKFSLRLPETVECNSDGKWELLRIRCVPVCGEANAGQKALMTSETTSNISTFPWHATLYVQKNSSNGSQPVYRCDATVVRANLLLTTARCVHDFIISWDPVLGSSSKPLEVLESYFITTGNIDHGSLLQDSQLIKKHRVKNVHTTCNYGGGTNISAADSALIELHEPLEFSERLLPVCLDDIGIAELSVEDRYYGSLRYNQTLINMSYSHCWTLHNATGNPLRVNDDKFCDSHNNESNSCMKNVINDGGGLVYRSGVWYLIGIVSQVFSQDTDRGGIPCGKDLKLLYNKVSKQMTWIQRVMDSLERSKYPPCSRYLPPFNTKTATPAVRTATLVTKTTTATTVMAMTMTRPTTTPTPITRPTTTSTPITRPTTTSTPITRPTPTPTPITRPITTSTRITRPITTSTPITRRTTTPTPITLSSTFRSPIGLTVKAAPCLVPRQPLNGEWRLHQDFCESDMSCRPAEGTTLEPGSQLVYSCAPGYRVDGNTDVYCRANGNWSSVPVCTEIKCISLESELATVTCSRFGEWVDCNLPVFSNTLAKVSCRSGYRAQMTQSETMECKTNGNWEPAIPHCVSVCGATFGRSPLFVEREITAAAYPWHATLYVQKNTLMANEKEVQCGATLIQSNLLLTAAHCVYNDKIMTTEDPRKLFILMSNVHRHYDSPLHDFHTVRRGAVKNVYVHCNYHGLRGNYVADIALLELQEPFEFFNIQLHPACLDFSGYNAQVFGPGASGEFLGFGKTAIGEPSDVLQSISLPYVSQTQCNSSNIPLEKQAFITNDKFCAGYNNGTAVCLGDGGGGLFVQINGLWFVVGVVSVDLNTDLNNGEDTCDGNVFTLYTNIFDYMAWILDVMFHLERYRSYPQCSQ